MLALRALENPEWMATLSVSCGPGWILSDLCTHQCVKGFLALSRAPKRSLCPRNIASKASA
jgi:hypothetical protein